MTPIRIAEVRFSEAVSRKIEVKHNVNEREVREACCFGKRIDARWDDHPELGRRPIVRAETHEGWPIVVVLMRDEDDPDVWICKTARRI